MIDKFTLYLPRRFFWSHIYTGRNDDDDEIIAITVWQIDFDIIEIRSPNHFFSS